MDKKITKTFEIEDFTSKVKVDDYNHYFTNKEIDKFGTKRKKDSLAIRYVLKELLIDHFNDKINYTDIEILNDTFGKPHINCNAISKEQLNRLHFSFSHCKDTVVVLLIIEKDEL